MLHSNYNEPLFSIIFLIPWFCGMSCSLNEWATAPDCMKSGKHVSTLLDKNPSLHVRPSVPAPRNEAAVPHWPHVLPPAPKSISQTPGTHTHLHRQTHSQVPSSLRNSPTFSNSSYMLWRSAVLSISHDRLKSSKMKRLQFLWEQLLAGVLWGHPKLPWPEILNWKEKSNLELLQSSWSLAEHCAGV